MIKIVKENLKIELLYIYMHSGQSVTFYILFSYLRGTDSTWFSVTNCLYDYNLALACRNSEMLMGEIRQIALLKKTLLPVHYDNLCSPAMHNMGLVPLT